MNFFLICKGTTHFSGESQLRIQTGQYASIKMRKELMYCAAFQSRQGQEDTTIKEKMNYTKYKCTTILIYFGAPIYQSKLYFFTKVNKQIKPFHYVKS